MSDSLNATKLSVLFAFKNGRSFKKTEWATSGLPIIRIQNLNDPSKQFNRFLGDYDPAIEIKQGDLLFSWSGTVGSSFGPHIWSGETGVLNQHIFKVSLLRETDKRYAFYALRQITAEVEKSVRGAVGLVHVTKTDLKNFEIPNPPLPEQKRIVAILDEAFGAIAKAKENAEKNIANARELFDSYLNGVFSEKGERWKENSIGELVEIKHGFAFKSEFFVDLSRHILLTPGNFFEEGGFRDRGNRTKYYEGEIPNDFILQENAFLIAMTEQAAGLLGSSLIVPEGDRFLHNQRLGLVQPKPDVVWNNKFFHHAFNTKHFRRAIHSTASGVKVRHTSPKKICAVRVAYPATAREQQAIAEKIDRVFESTKQITVAYHRKLQALDELRQSFLRKAFSGQLIRSDQSTATAKARVALPESVLRISTTDLHAGVLALAYQTHQSSSAKKRHFGHVKGEKIAHMVEHLACIDLGRTPIKDAAGPNDYPHLIKVESRARKASFFDSKREDDRYVLTPKAGFDDLVEKTKMSLGDKLDSVMAVIEMMAPMTTRQAEILATTHAAWNNLLLRGESCDDYAIITEARENWHERKLSIDRGKFSKAIDWIREKRIEPKGEGKIVASKPPAKKTGKIKKAKEVGQTT